MHSIIELENYDEVITGLSRLDKSIYSDVAFKDCKFSSEDWRSVDFSSCLFLNCALETIECDGLKANDIHFIDCKISGVDFFKCSSMLLELSFTRTILQGCNFSGLSLIKSKFLDSNFRNCYFNECILKESDFSGSSFANTVFHNTDLRKADLSDAKEYTIDPTTNKISKAKFSFPHAMGLLKAFDIKIVQ